MMRTRFLLFSAKNLSILDGDATLVLHMEERIVTLLKGGQIYTQCRFPRRAFRLLALLLKAPYGADYGDLLACLHCSEVMFHKVMAAPSYEDLKEILALHHLSARQASGHMRGKTSLEKDLKVVRRALKERGGVDWLFKKHRFALAVKSLRCKGYLLTRDPPAHQ